MTAAAAVQQLCKSFRTVLCFIACFISLVIAHLLTEIARAYIDNRWIVLRLDYKDASYAVIFIAM